MVVTFLKHHPRIHIERFPAYAPELNPVEYLWSQTDSALSNGAPENTSALSVKLRKELERIRSSQKLLRGCIHGSGLPLFKL